MLVGSVLGVLFVSLVRRVLVEDPELPFPESVAASQIHKAGQMGAQAAKYLFYNMAFGGAIFLAGAFNFFATDKDWLFPVGQLGKSSLRLGATGTKNALPTGGVTVFSGPTVSPAYIGVGYVIGPMLASLNFSGTVIAWGLLIPLLMYFMGPQLHAFMPANADDDSWVTMANTVWRYIVRPIAVGGMLFGAAYTLFRMRKSLGSGLARAFAELRTGAAPIETTARTERYMSSRMVLLGIFGVFCVMIVLYRYLSGGMWPALVAAIVMLVVGFCFATVSGYLVGVIGSSNNPISGLTLSTVIIAALLMVALGFRGSGGVIAVLGVAAVVCVSSAVAGELLQDFKVGYIIGGTPRSIQIVELIAVVVASAVMYFPLMVLHQGNINNGGIGFGDQGFACSAGGPDGFALAGDCGRRYGLAIDRRWHPDGTCAGPDRREESDAGGDRDVSADWNHVRDFHRRHGALDDRYDRHAAWNERSAEDTGRKRGRVGGVRNDCGRSAHGTGDGYVQFSESESADGV